MGEAFSVEIQRARRCSALAGQKESEDGPIVSRRSAIEIGLAATGALTAASQPVAAIEDFVPSKRPFSYLVDSTIPPTLIGLNAQKEMKILKGLGKGSGTSKVSVTDTTLNLNNIVNLAVFGAINAIKTELDINEKTKKKSGPGYASFACLGVPKETTESDIELARTLLSFMLEPRKEGKGATGLGLWFAPLSTQPALEAYGNDGNKLALSEALAKAGVPDSFVELYSPLLEFARSNGVDLLAMSPEYEDIGEARRGGLQNVNSDRRGTYVMDAEGFIGLTQDKKYQVYTERSLFKDFEPIDEADQIGNFFAERILVHETGATAVARYATSHPESFVALVAPIPDVRYMSGINGRIPRVCGFINKENNRVTEEAVTTILLNPTAIETLSGTRRLRLEIGTAPETIPYQAKVSDYLWFSTMPKVNLLHRLMST